MNKIILEDLERLYGENIIDWQRFSGKTVLITGANGMLGSYMTYMLIYLNEHISHNNIQIYAVCRNLQKAKIRFGKYLNKNYFNLIDNNLNTPIHINERIDFIIHAASLASPQCYQTNPVDVILPNALGTYHLLELARCNHSEGFLFFSTGEVYGSIQASSISETDMGYLDPMDIRSCYGESKRIGETLCNSYAVQYNVPTTIVRPSHTYGPTLALKGDNRVFAEFVSNIVHNQDIEMKSDGSATRIFCYIYDAVLAYFKILLDGGAGQAYNVAGLNGVISIKELADILVNLYPNKRLVVKVTQRESTCLEHISKLHPDLNTKKLEALGWKAQYNIATGFKRTIDSFLYNNSETE